MALALASESVAPAQTDRETVNQKKTVTQTKDISNMNRDSLVGGWWGAAEKGAERRVASHLGFGGGPHTNTHRDGAICSVRWRCEEGRVIFS